MSIYWWIANGMWRGKLLLLLPSWFSAFFSEETRHLGLPSLSASCSCTPWATGVLNSWWGSVTFGAGVCGSEHKIVLKFGKINTWIEGRNPDSFPQAAVCFLTDDLRYRGGICDQGVLGNKRLSRCNGWIERKWRYWQSEWMPENMWKVTGWHMRLNFQL